MQFVPYKHFRIRTHLNREQCRQRLTSVVQPQKVIPVIAIPDSEDNRLIFKGQVKPDGFYLRYIDRSRPPSRRTTDFLAISGQLKASSGGTDVVIKATLDPLFAVRIVLMSLPLALLGLYGAVTVHTDINAPQSEKLYFGISGVLVFLHYTIFPYLWFSHVFAKALQKPSKALRHIFDSAS